MAARLHRANYWSAATPVDPITYYAPGSAGLSPATSTDDYYHMCGLYGLRPYDLRKWGSHGAAMETLHGHRYFWMTGPDHPTSLTNVWRDSGHFAIGFTDDPGVLPQTLTPVIAWNNKVTNIHDVYPLGEFTTYEWGWCTYNPEDPDGLHFYFSGEGAAISAAPIQHAQILWRSVDLITWTCKKVSHSATVHTGWTSFHTTRRIDINSWESQGLGDLTALDVGTRWVSSNGIDYTMVGTGLDRYRKAPAGTMYNYAEIIAPPFPLYDPAISEMGASGGDEFAISGQRSWLVKEQVGVYVGNFPKPEYISIVPVDDNLNILPTPAPDRISPAYTGNFPGPTYLQNLPYFLEDGVLHIYATHGFPGPAGAQRFGYPYPIQWDLAFSTDGVTTNFSGTNAKSIKPYSIVALVPMLGGSKTYYDNGSSFVGAEIAFSTINYATGAITIIFSTPPDAGQIQIMYVENAATFNAEGGSYQISGGLSEQFLDYYTHVVDSALALDAAPIGVAATCAAGVVTLTWYDALPANTYRVYRGATSATQATLVGNVTGVTITDSPTTGQQWWYKVVTLHAGIETGYRVVHVYVSSSSSLANQHANRVIDDGGDIATINFVRLDAVISFLTAQGWLQDLLFWASPAFGVKTSAGHVTKIYCLGTTRLPRGGDLTFPGSSTTYSATGLNGTGPAFINASASAHAYFGNGRFNPIRRKRQITVAALYARTQTSADITFLGLKTGGGRFETNWIGTEQPGLSLVHAAGTPGTVTFTLKDDEFGLGTRQNTATVTAASASYNIAIGTFDGSGVTAWSNGVAGFAVQHDPDPHHFRDTVLAGARGASLVYPVLGVGSRNCSCTMPQTTSIAAGTYDFPTDEAAFTAADILVLARGVNAAGAAALNSLLDGFAAATGRKYLIADFHAEGDGVDDDGPEISAAGAYFSTLPFVQNELVMEPGHTFNISTGQFWTRDVRDLTVTGTGATVHVVDPLGIYDYGAGNVGILGTPQTVLVATVTAGATTATMLDIADASKLTIGDYVLIGGLRTQVGGSPPNLHFFEYVKVTNVVGTTVTFDRAVRQTYKSTWFDEGAARLLTTGTWDTAVQHVGYTVNQIFGGHSKARDVRLRDMTLLGDHAFTPSGGNLAMFDNVDVPTGNPEVDKLIEIFALKDSSVYSLLVQSSSLGLLYLDNTALTRDDGSTGSLRGTPRHTVIARGSSIALLKVGCFYGCTKSITASDSLIEEWQYGAASFDLGGDAQTGVQVVYSMSGGTITMPRASRAVNVYPEWVVPGAVAFFGGKYPYEASFEIVDISADATNIHVTTSLAGGFPSVPLDSFGRLQVRGHPCPRITVTNCTGSEDSLDLSNAPAGRPLGSWSRRTYTAAHTSAMQAAPLLMGRISQILVEVTQAFTGGSLRARFIDMPVTDGANVESRYEPIVDLSRTGLRTITPSGVTGNGGNDDLMTLPSSAWAVGAAYAGFNSFSVQSGPGSVTVTYVLDQEAEDTADTDYDELLAMAQALVGDEPPPVDVTLLSKVYYINFFVDEPFVGPLDPYTTGLTGAWSVGRRLLTSWTGSRYALDAFDTTRITNIVDQTGSSHPFVSTGVNMPAVTTVGSITAGDFVANTSMMQSSAISNFITVSDGFFVWVGTLDSFPASYARFFHDIAQEVIALLAVTTGSLAMAVNWDGSNDTASTALATGAHVITWRHQGGTLAVSVDGGAEVTTSSGNTTTLVAPLQISDVSTGVNGFDGKFIEMYCWNVVPSAPDRAAIIAQAKAYVGI